MIRTRITTYLSSKTILSFLAVLVTGICASSHLSHAGAPPPPPPECPKGLPCTEALTPFLLDHPHIGPNAPKSDSSACDANFMNQIYAKAFLEAEREVVINNAMILKPDSVLEYSCFDQQAAAVAIDGAPIFSGSDEWAPGSVSIRPGTVDIDVYMDFRLDTSIELLVLESLKDYVDRNFAHDFLGGAAVGDNNNIADTIVTVSTAPCDFMYLVHDVSRCDDFALNTRFMTFDSYFSEPDLISNDPRILPQTCPNSHQITQDILNVARNEDWTFATFDPVNVLLPIQRADETACPNVEPIPTGVTVAYEAYDEDLQGNPITVASYQYEEKFCSNPGCWFDNGGNADGADDRCRPYDP